MADTPEEAKEKALTVFPKCQLTDIKLHTDIVKIYAGGSDCSLCRSGMSCNCALSLSRCSANAATSLIF